MNPDYENPEVDAAWCDAERLHVENYLADQKLTHGAIGESPAWHIAPIVAIWAVESVARPGWIGWWVVSGDVPTDYISAAEVDPPQHPQKPLAVFVKHWLATCREWDAGRTPSRAVWAGPELRSMLESRAHTLREWIEEDELWAECDE